MEGPRILCTLYDHFWFQSPEASVEACRRLEIYKAGPDSPNSPDTLGVRALAKLEKGLSHLGILYYGGLLVSFYCGWNSCGWDFQTSAVVRQSTLHNNCLRGTWLMPYGVYGFPALC